ncbi:MAG: ABC transporter permease subunit [FCB group bacterium]|jgi:oligopeptide transport system permease protein|nr:ABC transporter permease subunit [FCB group bacterium]
MLKFVLKRIAEFVPVLLVIVTLTFFLVRLAPGGPFDSERAVSPEVMRQLEAHYNLDAPLWRQYVDYVAGVLQGDLGPSFKKPSYTVREWILMRLPVSLELGAYALVVALAIGLTAGVIASLRPNSWTDYVPMSMAMAGICLPTFVLGPLLVLVFGLWLEWLPVAEWNEPATKVLPSLTLGTVYAAYIARLSRGGMLEVLSQDFIRTARAKGLNEASVVLKHALRGGLQPVVAFLGPAAAGLLTGSFVVETIFQIPGLGREFVQAAFNRDYTMILGTVLLYASLILVLNLLVDVVLAWLDPRLRYE